MELFKPEAGLFFWMLVSFLGLFLILRKFAWPIITKGIEERNKHIESALAAADEAKAKLDGIKEESEAMISEARQEQLKVLQEAKNIKEHMLSDAKAEAKKEASAIIEDAHIYITRQKEETMKEIDKKVADLSIGIAEKILRKKMEDAQEQRELAERLTENLSDN